METVIDRPRGGRSREDDDKDKAQDQGDAIARRNVVFMLAPLAEGHGWVYRSPERSQFTVERGARGRNPARRRRARLGTIVAALLLFDLLLGGLLQLFRSRRAF